MTHCADIPPTRRGRLNRWLLALLALLPLVVAAALVDGPNGTVYAIARGADGTIDLGGNFHLLEAAERRPFAHSASPIVRSTGTSRASSAESPRVRDGSLTSGTSL